MNNAEFIDFEGHVYEVSGGTTDEQIIAMIDSGELLPAQQSAQPQPQQIPDEWGLPHFTNRGAYWGLNDEIEAGIQGTINTVKDGGNLFDNIGAHHQQINTWADQYAEQNPNKALAAETAGGLLSGYGTAKAVANNMSNLGMRALDYANMSGLQKLGNMTAPSALAGGLYGYNTERDAVSGGLYGAAVPLALTGTGKLGGAAIESGKHFIAGMSKGHDTKAVDRLALQMGELGETPALLNQRADTMREPTLAEVSLAARNEYDAAIKNPRSNAMSEAQAIVDERKAAEITDINNAVSDALSVDRSINPYVATKSINKLASEEAKPLYDAFYGMPDNQQRALLNAVNDSGIANRPSIQAAQERAQKYMQEDGIAESQITPALYLDYIQRGLRAIQEGAKRGDSLDSNYANQVNETRQALLQVMDEFSPEFNQARKLWAGKSSINEQFDNGRAAIQSDRISIDQINDELSQLTPSEQTAYRMGVADYLRTKVNKTRDSQNSGLRIADNLTLDKLEAIATDPTQFDAVIKEIKRAQNTASLARPLGDTNTARYAQQIADQNKGALGQEALNSTRLALTDQPGALAKAFDWLTKKTVSTEQINEMAALAMRQWDDPAVQNIVAKIENKKAPTKAERQFLQTLDNDLFKWSAGPGVLSITNASLSDEKALPALMSR